MDKNLRCASVIGLNGNLASVLFDGEVSKGEVGFIEVENETLKGEVIRIRGSVADMQIYEPTEKIKVGDKVSFTGEILSVELGPGLLTQVFDGLQNPLPDLAKQCGFFLQRGVYLNPIPNKKWDFTPLVTSGKKVVAGDHIGEVPEGVFTHKIMVPFNLGGIWTVESINKKGTYGVRDTVAIIKSEKTGEVKNLSMVFSHPIKKAVACYKERLLPTEPMITQIRIVDSFLPVSKGGTYCTPGPFGAGKTVLQHTTSRNADVDVVIIAACGERAGEVVEILKEFPLLKDPRTGKSLMERTIIICNTSSMPVAAREASVYTAVTLAEYYRQMGLDVLLLADSTSRWAQAMREMSGRLEEIPGDEAFPAYLESSIAAFYERAGVVRLNNGDKGSITICGSVSPAGGNFDEPVTQATLKVVGAFHGLSRERSDARKYPAIHPLESWSKYKGVLPKEMVDFAKSILIKGCDVNQMMRVVGEEGVSLDDYIIYLKEEFLDSVYLQQNTFDRVDSSVSPERQNYVFDIIYSMLKSDFKFSSKDEARNTFNIFRQLFLDWNTQVFKGSDFNLTEEKIHEQINKANGE